MDTEKKKGIMREHFAGIADRKFLKWLEQIGFYEAPASKGHHGAYPGGLFDHSLFVTRELINITDSLRLTWERRESPLVVGMLHDICKVDDYVWEKDGEGEKPAYNRERSLPGHGDKSLEILAGHIILTDEEKLCIRYHMGAFTDRSEWEFYTRAVQRCPNVLYTHMADMIASQIGGV